MGWDTTTAGSSERRSSCMNTYASIQSSICQHRDGNCMAKPRRPPLPVAGLGHGTSAPAGAVLHRCLRRPLLVLCETLCSRARRKSVPCSGRAPARSGVVAPRSSLLRQKQYLLDHSVHSHARQRHYRVGLAAAVRATSQTWSTEAATAATRVHRYRLACARCCCCCCCGCWPCCCFWLA